MTRPDAEALCDELICSTGAMYEVVQSTPANTTAKGQHLPQLGGFYVKRVGK